MLFGKTARIHGRIGVAVAISIFIALSGYGPMVPRAQAWEHDGPGWYGDMGYECYDADWCTGELHGYVGLPVEWKPKAHCVGGGWNFERVEIVTGGLPPGLTFEDGNIVGVPARAGTWHLRVKFVGMECAGSYYGDHTQDLHITTEGSSSPGSVY